MLSLGTSLTEAETHIESLQSQIAKLDVQITRQESRIAAEGGSYARKQENLKLRQEQLHADIEVLENDIRDLCGELFPFALVPELLKRLGERLVKEIELDEWETRDQVLKTQNTKILETLASGEFWDDTSLSVPQIKTFQDKIEPLLKTQPERPETLQGFEKIRDRSPSEYLPAY